MLHAGQSQASEAGRVEGVVNATSLNNDSLWVGGLVIRGISVLKGKIFKCGYIQRNSLARECCPAQQISLPHGFGDMELSVIQVQEKH